MKKQFLTIGTALLLISGTNVLTSCGDDTKKETNGHDHAKSGEHKHGKETKKHDHNNGDGHAHEHGEEASIKTNNEYTGEKVKDLSLIIDSYLNLKNSLAGDNEKTAAKAANKMLTAFNGFDESTLSEAQTTEYTEIKESAIENAEHIVKNINEIAHQREHLVILSQDITDLVKLVGTDKKLYIDFCPMADNNKGATWLSATAEISNPYMGSKMPKCGKVKEEIN